MNANLHKAKSAKNDEFYTQISDIEKELGHYWDYFKGKTIFCNCDDPEESHFWKYFSLGFEFLGLKKLISTHYETDKPSYKLEMIGDINKDGKVNKLDVIRTALKQNGDFRSPECIEILKEADIVITNPPFSMFREYVTQLMEYDKKFLIIGNMNALFYREVFRFIKENRMWLGITHPSTFIKPDGSNQKFGNIDWFTNLPHTRRNENLILYQTYKGSEQMYPAYDNYNAIEVSRVQDIPMDYTGVMGVPITFLGKHNPEQFQLLGIMNTGEENKGIRYEGTPHGRPIVGGVEKYARLLIRANGATQ
jgi:hypothetical protein